MKKKSAVYIVFYITKCYLLTDWLTVCVYIYIYIYTHTHTHTHTYTCLVKDHRTFFFSYYNFPQALLIISSSRGFFCKYCLEAKLLYQLDPDTKKLTKKLKKKYKIIKKQSSMIINQTCINNNLLPKYTR